MFNESKGHMKEIAIGNGTLMIVATFNPLELDQQERELVFALVDRINDFERATSPHGDLSAGQKGDRL